MPGRSIRVRAGEASHTISAEPDPKLAHDAAGELVASGAQLGAYGALLRSRDYRLWFTSSLLSSLGDWIGLFALQVLILSTAQPGSRFALFGLGAIMMARLLPSVFFGPVAGVLADRYDRRSLLVFTDLSRAVLFVFIATSREFATLFILTFAVECLSLLYASAKDASLPAIVNRRHLTQANQLNLFVAYGLMPFGAVVATVMVPASNLLQGLGVVAIDPTTLALLFNAGTFLLGGLLIWRVHLPHHRRDAEAERTEGVTEELRAGLRFIRGLPMVRALITGVVGVFFGAGVVVTLGPEFVRAELGRAEADWYGLMTMVGSGLLGGIALVPFLTARVRKEKLFPVALGLAAALATLVAFLPTYALTQIVGLALGALAGMSIVIGYTMLHENTADDVRAKTFAAFYTGTRASMFAALGLAPFLAGAIGTGTLILGARRIPISGVRVTILLGGLIALYSAVSSGRRIFASLRDDAEARPVRLRHGTPGAPLPGGLFVTFEGIEGSGKSTQIAALAASLTAEGYDVLVTREPGGPPIAERIRALLLDPNAHGMHPRTEALLYAAARVEHVERVILPALEQGRVVLCDRYIDSSLAYQGFARELGDADIQEINRWATGGLLPDVVVLLRLDPEEGLRRVADRSAAQAAAHSGANADDDEADTGEAGKLAYLAQRGPDRIERESMEFHRSVAEGYQALARRDRARYVVVDGAAGPASVSRRVRAALHSWLPDPPPSAPPGSPEAAPDSPEASADRPEAAG